MFRNLTGFIVRKTLDRGVTVNVKADQESVDETVEIRTDYTGPFIFTTGLIMGIAVGYISTRSLVNSQAAPIINVLK